MNQGQNSSSIISHQVELLVKNNKQFSNQNLINFVKQTGEGFISSSKKLQEQHFINTLQQLNIKYRQDNFEDLSELKTILLQILKYPSSQLADLHRNANKLGIFDLPQNSAYALQLPVNQQIKIQNQYCQCCGFVKQTDQLKLCQSNLQSIENLGISTFLYFRTIKNLCFLLISLALIYSIFAISTNIIAINESNSNISLNYLTISMGSKTLNLTEKNKNYIVIQAWIGFVLVVLWGFIFFFQYHWQKQKQQKVDMQTLSAADFTIVIQNLPIQMDQSKLQQQFDQYQKQFEGVQLKIASYNQGKPFYLDQSQMINEKIKELLEQEVQLRHIIIQWVIERQSKFQFSKTKQEREKIIQRFYNNKTQIQREYQKQFSKVQQKLKKQTHSAVTTTAFVTFQKSQARQFLTKDEQHKVLQKVRQVLPCIQNQKAFKLKFKVQNTFDQEPYFAQHKVFIQKAPEPQDIEWMNIGITYWSILKNTILTYSITITILAASFGIVYGLAIVQNNNSGSRYISFFISILISFINILISQVIRYLSKFQRNLTKTRYQTSLALKSILAQLLNSILIPIITNKFIKNNIYEPNGLADDIFLLGITNAFLPPILKLFDGYYFFLKFMRWYSNLSKSKLWLSQSQLNQLTARMQFQTGYQYIYLINLFLFTCFFISLQPILSIFSLFGLIFMFWAQKYSLFSRCRRPVPGTNILNTYLTQMIYFGGLFYSLGSLMLSNFMFQYSVSQTLPPNILALCIGVIIILIPYGYISQKIDDEFKYQVLDYYQKKKYLPSEYDRLNPATAKQAIIQFKKYIKKQRQKLKNYTEEAKNKMLKLFLKQGKQSYQKNDVLKMFLNNKREDKEKMKYQPVNPQFIANILFKNQYNNGENNDRNQRLLNQILNFSQQTNKNTDFLNILMDLQKLNRKEINYKTFEENKNNQEEYEGLEKDHQESKISLQRRKEVNQIKIKTKN